MVSLLKGTLAFQGDNQKSNGSLRVRLDAMFKHHFLPPERNINVALRPFTLLTQAWDFSLVMISLIKAGSSPLAKSMTNFWSTFALSHMNLRNENSLSYPRKFLTTTLLSVDFKHLMGLASSQNLKLGSPMGSSPPADCRNRCNYFNCPLTRIYGMHSYDTDEADNQWESRMQPARAKCG